MAKRAMPILVCSTAELKKDTVRGEDLMFHRVLGIFTLD